MRLLNIILDTFFPIKCVSCNQIGYDLCIKCLSEFPLAERESANWIFPVYDYRHPSIKKALWLFKYKGRKRLAGIFAEIIYDKILEELSELSLMENFSDIILIPIPLSAKRRRERGYNQAELICRKLVKIDNLRHGPSILKDTDIKKSFSLEKNILIKSKETEHQARIENRALRLKNIIDSFSVKNDYSVKNRNIILIDDITTTGATLTEAKKTLKKAGARKIIAFTVAH